MPNESLQLTAAEIHAAFAAPAARQHFPPIITPATLATVTGKTAAAVYHQNSRHQFKGAARKRGKHVLFWRDRAIAVVFGQSFRCSPTGSIQLTDDEINATFDDPALLDQFPPVLSPERLADLVGLSRSTIYLWIKLGRFASAAHRRGGNLFLWRNRAVQVLFNDPDWRKTLVQPQYQ